MTWLLLFIGLLSVASAVLWVVTMVNVGVDFALSFQASFVLTFRYDLTFWCGLLNLFLTYSTLLETIMFVFGLCTSAKYEDPLPNAGTASSAVSSEVQSTRRTGASPADARKDVDAQVVGSAFAGFSWLADHSWPFGSDREAAATEGGSHHEHRSPSV
jgi:hypothetical protein